MYTNRFFTILVIIALAAVVVLTVRETISTSAVTSDDMIRSREADTARWEAMAEYYPNSAKAERSRMADTARWEAMAEYYLSLEEAQSLQRGRAADAARWTAWAEYYAQIVPTIP